MTYESLAAQIGAQADTRIAELETELAAKLAASAFVYGETLPDDFNVGTSKPPATRQTTNVKVTSNGATYERTVFDCDGSLEGSGNRFVDCVFRGPRSRRTTPRATVVATKAGISGNVFERCTFERQAPSRHDSAAIQGYGFTLDRCLVRGHLDGVGIYNPTLNAPQDVFVYGSWIQGLSFWCPDPGQSDNRSHCDAVQLHRHINNVYFFGTRIDALVDPRLGQASDPVQKDASGKDLSGFRHFPDYWAMSAFMLSPRSTGAYLRNFEVDRCWLSGGEVVFNFGDWTAAQNVRITNNRVGPIRPWPNQPAGALVIAKSGLPLTVEGNVDLSGQPMNVRVGG